MSKHPVVPTGWYGPPTSRRWHYFDVDGRSLCGKWLVPSWAEPTGTYGLLRGGTLVGKAYGPASGDCVACKRKLEPE